MKNLTLTSLMLLFAISIFSQQYSSPPLEWRTIDIPPIVPPSGILDYHNGAQAFDPLEADETGEDWWYCSLP